MWLLKNSAQDTPVWEILQCKYDCSAFWWTHSVIATLIKNDLKPLWHVNTDICQ